MSRTDACSALVQRRNSISGPPAKVFDRPNSRCHARQAKDARLHGVSSGTGPLLPSQNRRFLGCRFSIQPLLATISLSCTEIRSCIAAVIANRWSVFASTGLVSLLDRSSGASSAGHSGGGNASATGAPAGLGGISKTTGVGGAPATATFRPGAAQQAEKPRG